MILQQQAMMAAQAESGASEGKPKDSKSKSKESDKTAPIMESEDVNAQ